MKNRNIAIIALWFVGGMLMAQNERAAFRYAQYSPTGTARYTSLAGSMGAFGADFTTLSANNPAGIALFKRMEISLTLAVPYYQISSTYNGENQVGTRYNFNCNNVGVVFAIPTSNAKWKMLQFATGLNNLARYRGTSIASGLNTGKTKETTNFFDHVAEISNGIKPESLRGISDVGYNYFLMDPMPDGSYSCIFSDYINQRQVKEMDGALNEYIFSFGGNYEDKLFLGATLGIPFFNYSQKTTYTENVETYDDTVGYDFLRFDDEFRSSATGVNLKLGFIYQPAKFVRLGLAFHTPTWYPNVTEKYAEQYEILGVYQPLDSLCYDERETTNGRFNYQLTTPFRAMANVAFIINKYGFINIDYEFTDYSTSNFQSNAYNFVDENKNIKNYYREVHTIRAGGELNLSPLVLRLGYSYSTNPYKGVANINGSSQTISAGIGLKGKMFFADFGYMYRFTNDKDVFYDAASIHPYSSKIVNQVFALTLGLKMK
jgi:hypothetical protein